MWRLWRCCLCDVLALLFAWMIAPVEMDDDAVVLLILDTSGGAKQLPPSGKSSARSVA